MSTLKNFCKFLFSSISAHNQHSEMEENLVLLRTQVNREERNVGRDIKVPVSKPVHRSCDTNQSCVQSYKILITLKRSIALSFKFADLQYKISIVLWSRFKKQAYLWRNCHSVYKKHVLVQSTIQYIQRVRNLQLHFVD